MTQSHRAKMAPLKDAPAGLETDDKGDIIPFENRTRDDQEKVQAAIAHKLHGVSASYDQAPCADRKK